MSRDALLAECWRAASGEGSVKARVEWDAVAPGACPGRDRFARPGGAADGTRTTPHVHQVGDADAIKQEACRPDNEVPLHRHGDMLRALERAPWCSGRPAIVEVSPRPDLL